MSIVVSNLTKIYGKQKAVDNISFEAREGEILGFLGPNGAGKSTTMKITTCYLPPTEGNVEVCGYKVTEQPIEVRKNVGYLPEHNPLYLDMYVQEYLKFIASMHKITGSNAKSKTADMIDLVGLEKEKSKKIGSLSKGYRQRVGLAQALIHDPNVLILDEPTTGLDPNQIQEIRQVIKNIAVHKTVIFSTHIMQEVQALCDRVIIINSGEIVADNQVGKLRTSETREIKIMLELESPADISSVKDVEGVLDFEEKGEKSYIIKAVPDTDIRGDIFRKAVASNWVITGLSQEEVSLENIFQNLTRKK
ncbi:gliding motility-associated ABC transporter ATP-binding subunit GldA [Chondrinema litorale]|uniref:gliding motility-associated ABC transporter ATP-binding subunit GldA n=1 Tax=Chondrinema litorale TaxID=2994555 RepID=UPI002542C6A3|nr:gliding motility-associated ABC transporter ATP-binding subunit GldA [Chondrinema litorale]UZR95862.1 gliding motility-associated ABC transporter ATP-binding subunit GldA [Chondrinema litorale]